jgi:hypothetical protein
MFRPQSSNARDSGTAILAQPDIKNNCNLEEFWCKIFQTVFSWVVVGVINMLRRLWLPLFANPFSFPVDGCFVGFGCFGPHAAQFGK